MKNLALLLAMAVAALGRADMDDLWRSTPFYHGASAYTDRKEDRVNLWPLLYHRAPATSLLWPLFSGSDDHLAVCPFYSQRRQRGGSGAYDEFNVLWPLCHLDLLHGENHVFPVYWGEGYFAVLPLLVDRPEYLFLPPFWYRKDGSCFAALPFFGWRDHGGDELWWAAAGLAGHCRGRNGSTNDWLLPFYWLRDEDLYSLPYSRIGRGGETTDLVCGGLLGHRTLPGGHHGFWAFPLFYADNRGLVTPLGGYSDQGDWLLLAYARSKDRFMSIPYGRYQARGSTHQWFATPLVGSVSGAQEGAYVFPFVDWEEDAAFASLQAGFESTCLQASADGRAAADAPAQSAAGDSRPAGGVRAERGIRSLFGLAYRRRTRISTRDVAGGGCELSRHDEEWSLPLLYNREAKETVVVGPDTREPASRRVDEWSTLMGPLYTNQVRVDTEGKISKARSRVLWWLWDREERDGKVSLDVFPGFTYDRHPDGYRKASFIWRLFRYEDDPKGGVSADLFFVPVWR